MTRLLLALVLAGCGASDLGVSRLALTDAGPSCTGDPSSARWTPHTIAPDIIRGSVEQHADGAAVADFDGDGLIDIAHAWERGDTVGVSLHPGAGNSLLTEGHPSARGWPRIDVATDIDAAEGVEAVDLDGDGAPDLLSASSVGGGGLVIHWNDDDALSWPRMTLTDSDVVSDRWLGTATADWSGDGGEYDVLSFGETSRLYVWEQPTTGHRTATNWTRTLAVRARWPMWAFPFDNDDDGDLDVLLGLRRTDTGLPPEGFAWAENGTTGGVDGTWTVHSIGETSAKGAANNDRRQAMIGCAGDVDDDGDTDFVAPYLDAGTSTWSHLRWFENDDSATTWTDHAISLPTELLSRDMKGCALADIDLDGDLDFFLTTAGNPNANVWWVEQTSSSWSFHEIAAANWESKLDAPVAVDVDGDGDVDVVVTGEERETGASWFANERCDP